MNSFFKGVGDIFLFGIIFILGEVLMENLNMSRSTREKYMLGVFLVGTILTVYLRHKSRKKRWSIPYGIIMFLLLTTIHDFARGSNGWFFILVVSLVPILFNSFAYLNDEPTPSK